MQDAHEAPTPPAALPLDGEGGGGRGRPKKNGVSRLMRLERRTAYLLLLPTFLVLAVIAAYPFGQVVYSSLTDAKFASSQPTSFVGLDNYRTLFAMTIRRLPPKLDESGAPVLVDGKVRYESAVSVLPRSPRRYRQVFQFGLLGHRYVLGAVSADFVRAVWDTVVFTVVAVALETILGMIIALTLSSEFRGRGAMRAAMLVPWAVITVVSARIWEWMLQPTRAGLFNALGSYLGLSEGRTDFFGNPTLQLPSMIMMDVWKTTPFMALLLLAGLATIPAEYAEAAKVDGAGPLRRFFRITLPLLTPTLAVALIFRTLDSLRVFDIFQVVLGNQRYSMASFAQDMLISRRDMGLSSAASVTIFVIIFVFALLYVRSMKVDT
ncbi:MAG: sugar ABC transporter permease [Trueperaceae bacterium]|nr:sugar ABC transporter permease [Trueperaceae bacterium]